MNAGGIRVVELRGGPAGGRRLGVPEGSGELTLPVDECDIFCGWVVYRRTAERAADGTEVWAPESPGEWAETEPARDA